MWLLAAGFTALLAVGLWPVPRNERVEAERPVGTAGYAPAPEADESPATLHDLETMSGVLDPHQLIGWHVDFHVRVGGVQDGTSFWIGRNDNRVVVVAMTPVQPGQPVRIIGTIEGRNRDVYIRADSVTPE